MPPRPAIHVRVDEVTLARVDALVDGLRGLPGGSSVTRSTVVQEAIDAGLVALEARVAAGAVDP